MDAFLWVLATLVAFVFAYSLQLTTATLAWGRKLVGVESGTGVQNAITPPWSSNLALVTYISVIGVPLAIWWQTGLLSAVGSFVLIIIGSSVAKMILPSPDGPHYTKLIYGSMVARHADFVRDGDVMRAEAIGGLVELMESELSP